jgi:hypothetical protein
MVSKIYSNTQQYIGTGKFSEFGLTPDQYINLVQNNLQSPMRVTFSDGTKLTFINNPRCGGYSVLKYLFKRFAEGDVVAWDRGEVDMSIDDFQTHLTINSLDDDLGTTFTIVRNPYNRVRSAYEHYYRTVTDITGERFNMGINGFVEMGIHTSQSHLKPQSTYLQQCDIVLSYEDLENEFVSKIVTPYFDLSKGGLVEKHSESFDGARDDESYIHNMTSRARQMIETWDSFVFDNYGYNKHV